MIVGTYSDFTPTYSEGEGELVEPLIGARHFIIGEKRWYIPTTYSTDMIKAIYVEITWEKNGKTFSEYVVSEGFSPDQIKTLEDNGKLN